MIEMMFVIIKLNQDCKMKQLCYKNINDYFKIKSLYIIFIYLLIFHLFEK